jgi:hypothetical protein
LLRKFLFVRFHQPFYMALSTLKNGGIIGKEVLDLGLLSPNLSGFTLRVQVQNPECKSVSFNLASPGKRSREDGESVLCITRLFFLNQSLWLVAVGSKGLYKCFFVDMNGKGIYFERWNGSLQVLVEWCSAFPSGTLVRVANRAVKVIPEAKRL